LAFLPEKNSALKRQLKPEKTASSMKRKAESLLSTEINFQQLEVMKVRIRSTCFILLKPLVLAKLS
jgi:hypothetical protein